MSLRSLSFFPLWNELFTYPRKNLPFDCAAALSVALLALPQSMAYAFVANLPAQTGIFAAVFGAIFSAGFGSSQYLISGPTTMVALLIQSGITEVMRSDYMLSISMGREELALVVMAHMVLMIGFFQIIAGLFRLGQLTQFASRSVIVGYTLSISFAIFITQLYPFCGIKEIEGYHPLIVKALYIAGHLHFIHVPTFVLSILCLVSLMILYKISKTFPGPVVVFLGASLIVYLLDLSPDFLPNFSEIKCGDTLSKVCSIKDLAPIGYRVPKFSFSYFDLRIFTHVFSSAIAIAILGSLEVTAIGRSYSKADVYDDDQEVYGLGVANLISSFFGAMPSSGSFSRSALNKALCARSRFAAFLSGVFVAILVFLLGNFVANIPVSALSALLFFTSYNLLSRKELYICLRSTKSDAVVVLVTYISSLIFGLAIALYTGIAVSILLYLRKAGVPRLVEYHFNDKGKLRRLEKVKSKKEKAISILQPEGELFFGAADRLKGKLLEKGSEPETEIVILQILNTRNMDASVCVVLSDVLQYYKAKGKHLLIAGVSNSILEILENSGLIEKIDPSDLFLAEKQVPSAPVRYAYARALELKKTAKS